MANVSVTEEDQMTDFQFKAIIKMILEMAKDSKDIESLIKKLESFLSEDKKD